MSEATLNTTQLLDTFQLFDKNKDGSISASEVRLTSPPALFSLHRYVFLLLASISMSKTANAC